MSWSMKGRPRGSHHHQNSPDSMNSISNKLSSILPISEQENVLSPTERETARCACLLASKKCTMALIETMIRREWGMQVHQNGPDMMNLELNKCSRRQ